MNHVRNSSISVRHSNISNRLKLIRGGIAAVEGFWAGGVHCGIKYKNKDLALIYSQVPCVAGGVFTQNKVQAAPIKVTEKHLSNNRAQAVIINSGNANCCTGSAGIQAARQMCAGTARKLGIKLADVLVASTGIIGQKLPVEKIEKKIDILASNLNSQNSLAAAEAIMTTDTKPKQIAVQIKIGKALVKIGGIAKGAGMISPQMATMLSFITTDAAISKNRLNTALREAVNNSFNLISVEGDTSTNDMVLLLANGLAGNSPMTAKQFKVFQQALNFVCFSLAKMIIKDAEGSTKFVEVTVEAAESFVQAKKVALRVANSPLIKTALFGENPNWGRIAACTGSADNQVQQNRLDIYLGSIKVMRKGVALKVKRQRLNQVFKKSEVQLRIALGLGKYAARIFTCDLSTEYVRINSEY